MELWQAIFLGCQIRKQSYGPGAILGDGSCAIEAANEAIGIPLNQKCFPYAVKAWPFLNNEVQCPDCKRESAMYWIIATCLNDRHHWTRERIALEFVKPIEESLTPKPIEVTLPAVGVEA